MRINPLLIGLYIILLLPVLGEFSRFELLGRSIIASDIIIPIFIVIWLFSNQKSWKFSKPTKNNLTYLALFILTATISLLLSWLTLSTSELIQGAQYLGRLILYTTLFPITITILNKTPQNRLLQIITISALLIAATGFIQLQILPDLETYAELYGYDPHINRLVGSWLDPNFIGGFFALIVTLLSAVLTYSKNRQTQIILSIAIAALLIATFLTYSRSAYLTLSAGLFIVGLLRSRTLLLAVIIAALLGISVSDRAQDRVNQLLESVNSITSETYTNPDPTARLRIENWNQTLTLIEQKPLLGHGYNNLTQAKFKAGFIKDTDVHSASGSDSSLLTITATTGMVGLFFYLLFYFHNIILSFKKWRESKNDKGIYLGITALLIALLVHSAFVNSLVFPQIMIFFWIILGLLHHPQKADK